MGVYGELKFRDLPDTLTKTIIAISAIMIIILAAALFSFLITRSGQPNEIAAWFKEIFERRIAFLLVLNFLLLIVGMFCQQGGKAFGDHTDPKAGAILSADLSADQTRAALFGDAGHEGRLRTVGVIISSATVARVFVAEMEVQAKNQGFLYLDAPIFGGAIKVAEGRLSIMAPGTAAAFGAADPLLDSMAETVHRLGDQAGPGSAMKAVKQLLTGGHIAAMGEALTFGASQGLDSAQVVKVVTVSAGTSWMFENCGPHVAEEDYTPHSKVDICLKDLGIVGDFAEASGLPVPINANAIAQFSAHQRRG